MNIPGGQEESDKRGTTKEVTKCTQHRIYRTISNSATVNIGFCWNENERKGRTCFSLSEAITQTYLLLITTSATTTAFWFWRLPQLYVTTRTVRHFSSYEFPPFLLPVPFVFSLLSFFFSLFFILLLLQLPSAVSRVTAILISLS